jgi:hypothetical protein
MANFDSAMGADAAGFNGMFAPLLGVAQSLFPLNSGSLDDDLIYVDYYTVTSTQPPTLSVSTSTGQPLLNLVFPNLNFTVYLQSGNNPDPSYTFTASATFPIAITQTEDGTLTLNRSKYSSGFWCTVSVIQLDSNPNIPPATQEAAQNELIPELEEAGTDGSLSDYVQSHFLNTIAIPTFTLGPTTFEATCEVGPPPSNVAYLMFYGALSPPVQLPSAGTAWPTSTWFAAFDSAALSTLVAIISQFTFTGYWSGGSVPVIGGHFSCSYQYQLSSVTASPGTGNQLSASANFSGKASFTWHDPSKFSANSTTPKFPFSGSVNASVSLTPQDIGNLAINVTLNDAGISDFSPFDIPSGLWDALPLSDITNAIEGKVESAINGTQFNFPVLTPTSFSIGGGSTVTIAPQNVAVNTITGPGGVPMSIFTFDLATSVG